MTSGDKRLVLPVTSQILMAMFNTHFLLSSFCKYQTGSLLDQ